MTPTTTQTPTHEQTKSQTLPVTLSDLKPPRHRLYLLFRDPDLRPPVYEEMSDDIDHVIRSVAKRFSDQSCSCLAEDQLVSDGYLKLSQLIDKGKLAILPTRKDFFSYLRCTVNNYIMGQVHRFRGTQKRTGKKVPKKFTTDTVINYIFEYFKRKQEDEGKSGPLDLSTVTEEVFALSRCDYRNIALYVCMTKILRADLSKFGYTIKTKKGANNVNVRYYEDKDKKDMMKCCKAGEELVQSSMEYQEIVDMIVDLSTEFESNKPAEFSIDSEESFEQVENITDNFYTSNAEGGVRHGGRPRGESESDMAHDIRTVLSPIQKLVFDELNNPSDEARFIALTRSEGKKLRSLNNGQYGSSIEDSALVAPNVDHGCMADAIGISLEIFEENLEIIKNKTRILLMEKDADIDVELDWTRNVMALSEHFQIQIPKSFVQNRKDVVKRCLTIAARLNNSKVTEEVAAMLNSVGAKAPESCNSQLSCYGVLYDKHEACCSRCSLASNCAAEAVNTGLGTVRLSPKLLGAKGTKVPSYIPKSARLVQEVEDSPDNACNDCNDGEITTSSERDDIILNHLSENYGKTKADDQRYYRHKDKLINGKIKFIFLMKMVDGKMMLRFCTPSDSIKSQLTMIKNGAYLPDNISAEKAIALIDLHAQETFK